MYIDDWQQVKQADSDSYSDSQLSDKSEDDFYEQETRRFSVALKKFGIAKKNNKKNDDSSAYGNSSRQDRLNVPDQSEYS